MGKHSRTDTQPLPVVPIADTTRAEPWHKRLRRYAKWWAAFLGATALTANEIANTSGQITLEGWITIAVSYLTALGVLGVKNREKDVL